MGHRLVTIAFSHYWAMIEEYRRTEPGRFALRAVR